MPLLLGDMEKEELRNALVLTQESAAIQILLECCLPTPQERASGSQLTALQATVLYPVFLVTSKLNLI
jgi:hypothetical protein